MYAIQETTNRIFSVGAPYELKFKTETNKLYFKKRDAMKHLKNLKWQCTNLENQSMTLEVVKVELVVVGES